MAWIQTISEQEATGELKREYEAAVGRAEKVYNVLKIMSLNPGDASPLDRALQGANAPPFPASPCRQGDAGRSGVRRKPMPLLNPGPRRGSASGYEGRPVGRTVPDRLAECAPGGSNAQSARIRRESYTKSCLLHRTGNRKSSGSRLFGR